MLTLPGHETLEKLHEGRHTLIFRARSEKNGQGVIFKTVNSAYPTPEIIAQIKREYEILTRFQNGGVIRSLELVGVRNTPVIILEDFGALALANYLEDGPLGLGEFLSLAVRLANILGEIHGKSIIHKDINPANIVWNREQDLVKIIDFGISLELSREVTGIKNPNMLEGTLAYISPEQTGRMNRFLDYRTDYYSLGVTFFRMLAGRLPFEHSDAMELVYAHIARQPPTLMELDENIPQAISDIIQKLMAKNVEDRYQSSHGLAADLGKCLREWEKTGAIKLFAPGEADVSSSFQIAQKLYGRRNEVDKLLNAFGRVSQGESELMLVSGLPGIGKSALVNEIQKPIMKLRGNYISGKYDRFNKDVPYSALLQAFSGLVKHLLAENQEQLIRWKAKILQALGPNGRVITDVIPELELVIGEQPEIPGLGPEEARNRFNTYFQFFMGVFCKREHPLVLFLDDLQWADHASLEMIKLFLSDGDVKHLFVIGAFRSNEVDVAHGLNLILDELEKTGVGVSSVSVKPLVLEHVTELLRDSLHWNAETTTPLAELLLRKTGGNPFFLGEFLKRLYQEQLLIFQPGNGWSWEIHKIEAMQVTDNVVELMAAKIKGLPGDCGALLKLGAIFGNSFTLENMQDISEKNPSEILTSLSLLLEAGLLNKLDGNYRFAHDRIQEAAYGLFPEQERIQEHYRIGHLELKRTNQRELPQKVFYIINHLNAARGLINSETEQRELAELNLMAGSKARSSAAYRPALNYLSVALGLLEVDSWEHCYELTLEVYEEATIAAFLIGDYEQMLELAETVIRNGRDVLDTVKVFEARIFASMAQNQQAEAVQAGLLILGRLGVTFPDKPTNLHILSGLLSVKWSLRGKTVEDLENLPQLTAPHELAIIRILSSISSSAYIARPNLLPLIIFATLKLTIKHGNSEYSPFSAYAAYGMIQCGVLGELDAGYGFGQLALRLLEKLSISKGRARTMYISQVFIMSWKEHLRDSLPPLKDAIRLAMEHGDPEFVCHAAATYSNSSFYTGRDLAELELECVRFVGMTAKLKQIFTFHTTSMIHQLILNLQGRSPAPEVLKGDAYDFERMLPVHLEGGERNIIFTAYFNNFLLNFLFGRYEKAMEYCDLAEPYLDSMVSTLYIPVFGFYKSLAQLALFQEGGKPAQKKFMRAVKKHQKQMKKWAAHAPMNFEHRLLLVEAEIARVQGGERKAREYYEQAIRGARENRYINEEALALELFGKFWLERGQEDIAGLYLSKARQAYVSWGARAKVNYLEETYPQLMQTVVYGKSGLDAGGTSVSVTQTLGHETTDRSPSGKLDLATVMKGSQAISGEIVLGNLLRKMIGIVMENAGARSGFLILENHNQLYVEAAGNLEREEVKVLQSLPLETCRELSAAVVQYAARTKENVVLRDASNEGPFTSDVHIAAHKPKSILCLPILNQGNLSAILYLENNLSTGAFTADRLEVLNLLSSQIAVSIDNARLYGNLEEKVQERTTELRDTLGQVQALKNKQDGDYFLTSQLLGPLARNEVQSKRVTVEFLVEQNKQFSYQKWENELGGDMCIAQSLILENSAHTVWLNADAMGKSMQGAGGALVLGAVFQSIIERTRLTSFDESQPADLWLQGVFKELQKVFESFDGSMLVSLVLGIVCDETGLLQMINAEHPWTVLYRDGKAVFIEEDISLYKLGAQEQDDSIHIYKTQLRSGDVVIAGSDGRDDLLLPEEGEKPEERGRIINSDEKQFLKCVEVGAGVLPEIKAALLARGELTDDLSLLRLAYE